ncbi:MAG: hypothetical protein AAF170_18630 [Bacteroidota bacterium]
MRLPIGHRQPDASLHAGLRREASVLELQHAHSSLTTMSISTLLRLCFCSLLLQVGAFSAAAQAPATLSHQGYLTNANGEPVDGNVLLTFRLYDADAEGTELWAETVGVEVNEGLFHATLGETEPLSGLTFDAPYWLGITVNSGDELAPRFPLSATPYSLHASSVADNAVTLDAIDPSEAADGQVLAVESGAAVWKTLGNGSGGSPNTLSAADGDPDPAVFVDAEGRVGVGRTNPTRALSVNGSLTFSNVTDETEAAQTPLAYIFESGTDNPLRGLFAHSPSFPNWGLFYEDAPDVMHFFRAGESVMTVQLVQRRVGINNDDPTETLSVGGTIESIDGGFKFPDETIQTTAFDPNAIEAGTPGVNSVDQGNDNYLVLVNRDNRIGAEWFGVRAPVTFEDQYGGMYIETNGDGITNSKPFYGYAHNNSIKGWHELDGASNEWRLVSSSSNTRFKVDLDNGNTFADGTFTPGGADLAEAFDVEGPAEAYGPGDVLAISTHADRTLARSAEAYSTLIAGVYATKPGVLLSENGVEGMGPDQVPLGVVGVVPTNVTDEGGPIRRGDLLVTSSTPGHAMKGDPDKIRVGMVLGRALEDFSASGQGRIQVLVNVQ